MQKSSINQVQDSQNRYKFIPRTLVFIEHRRKILLINKDKHKTLVEGKLNGIGGHLERGEDPYQAALREIEEETGLKVRDLQLCAMLIIDTETNPGILVFVFKARADSAEFVESEEGSLLFMDKNEIAGHPTVMQDLPFLINICDQQEENDPPKIIKYASDHNNELRIEIVN